MNVKIEQILEIWHKHFTDKAKQYSEFEHSDIEYFVGCILYNHFAFSKALENLKTIDLSYDFLSACGDEYDEIQAIIKSIEFNDEQEKLNFLQSYMSEIKLKYTKNELYLINRLQYHVNAMAQRYTLGIDAQRVDFQNPLYR